MLGTARVIERNHEINENVLHYCRGKITRNMERSGIPLKLRIISVHIVIQVGKFIGVI